LNPENPKSQKAILKNSENTKPNPTQITQKKQIKEMQQNTKILAPKKN
jgi:hypothetical protein